MYGEHFKGFSMANGQLGIIAQRTVLVVRIIKDDERTAEVYIEPHMVNDLASAIAHYGMMLQQSDGMDESLEMVTPYDVSENGR